MKKVGILINAMSKFIKIIDFLRPCAVICFESKAPAVSPILADATIPVLLRSIVCLSI